MQKTVSYTHYQKPNVRFAMANFFLLDWAMGINKYYVYVLISIFDLMIFAQNANYASFQIQGPGKGGLNPSYNAADSLKIVSVLESGSLSYHILTVLNFFITLLCSSFKLCFKIYT